MSRLVVFGCSLAYGVGLPDCWPNTSKPSKLSWTQIVADTLGKTLINKSSPGAANKRIWKTIANFKFKKDDTVIVLWTYPNRHTIFENLLSTKNLHHNHIDTDPISKAYYTEMYSMYDSFLMSRLYVDHANRILEEQGVKVYNLVIDPHYKYILGKRKSIPLYMGRYEDSYPKALDNDHLGVEGQTAFAADFLNYLGIDHTIDKPKSFSFFKQLKNIICR